MEQMSESASPYRYARLMELLDANGKNTVQKTVNILRDRKGLHNADIGDGNEKAINQMIAHHSVVFEPQKLMVWVSTSPWQLGQYVAYDLKKIFAMHGMQKDTEVADTSLNIAADSFLLTNEYKNFEAFRKFKQRLADGGNVDADSLVATDPQFYNAYVLAGDYSFKQKEYKKALQFYQQALTKEIATKKEEAHNNTQIKKINKITAP